MTLEEILKSQGLTDEQVQTITGEMKQNKIFTAGEENLDIRYGKLKTDSDAQKAELDKANGLIAELQKAAKGNEAMTGQIEQYKAEVEQLQNELKQAKIDAAVKVALIGAKAVDVDYLTYKLREKGDALELDENGEVKGLSDRIDALKTQLPAMFEQPKGKQVDPNRLPGGGGEPPSAEPKNLAEAIEQSYNTQE